MGNSHENAKKARDVLSACGIDRGAEYEALNEPQISALIKKLNQHRLAKYGPISQLREPSGGVGFRVRSFHDLLQRRASPRSRPG